jgi:dihydrofolate reductase
MSTRNIVAAVQVSLDGYMQGVNGEVDWVDSWDGSLGLVPEADTAVLGGGMYPGYEQLWTAIAADPHNGVAMLGREPTEGEVEYARWTQRTPHYVMSTTLDTVQWDTAHVMRGVSDLRELRDQPGGTIYVVGGGTLVSSLFNEGLLDELRLLVHPVILGGGTTFAPDKRKELELVETSADSAGRVIVRYRV